MAPKPAFQDVQQVVTLSDISSQILANAEVVFSREKDLKIVSGQSQSGLVHHTSIVASDSKSASVHKEYKVVLNGPGGRDRRSSMLALLEETERRISNEVLKRPA